MRSLLLARSPSNRRLKIHSSLARSCSHLVSESCILPDNKSSSFCFLPFQKFNLALCRRLLWDNFEFSDLQSSRVSVITRSVMTQSYDQFNGTLNGYEHEAAVRDKLEEQKIFLKIYKSGQQYHNLCPMCGGGGSKDQSLAVSISEDGASAKWICVRAKCGWRGFTKAMGASSPTITHFQKTKEKEDDVKGAVVVKDLTEESLNLLPLSNEVHSASVPTCYVRNVQDVDETLQESSCCKILDMSEGNCIGKDHEGAFQEVDSESDDDDEESPTAEEQLKGEVNDLLKLSEKEKEKIGTLMADRLLHAALDEPDEEEDGDVPEHKQRSLRVGILGAANAGKSSITNLMVGTKVAAVSRKRNTTLSEILGVMTKDETQILFYDTPGLVLDILGKPSKTDTRRRSESAWQLFSHCEVLVVVVDAYRQIQKPDRRVIRLVERLGLEENPHPKRVLCLNKVDIVQKKKDLLPLAQLFEKLPGYESIFMISALTGSGVKELKNYLIDQAVLRPWEEELNPLNEETVKTLSMEIVREHLLHHVHEEIPYELDHQLTDWQELEDGSLRIEQHFYLPKKGQCRILVGKGGSKIREIGIRACEELRELLGRKVHLYLEVKHT